MLKYASLCILKLGYFRVSEAKRRRASECQKMVIIMQKKKIVKKYLLSGFTP